ncbi:MAG: molybdopterin molybdotransferase MoeA [Holophaga sp.]|nr:molybdopterin molybdotransferase MoeA [Holophaga sp.]
MTTFQEALGLVLEHALPLPPRAVPLADALGLAAAEDIRALDPVPPFTNSAMDGFAVRAGDCAGPVRLPVQGEIPAGRSGAAALEPGAAYRIMTGAVIPAGADTVVPVEEATAGPGWVELGGPLRRGAHVRLAGEDIPAGGLVVPRGRILRPAEIGVLAAIGCARVPARPRVRVAVITTGDELVDAGDRPGPGQIRDANIHSLAAQVRAAGAVPVCFPRVPDRREAVVAALEQALADADVVLTNGGISVGDFDYIKQVLEQLGAEQVFWRVAQKPGGPLGLWRLQGKLVFGIPGNPVAAMLMVEEFVRPALLRMMGFPLLHRPERTGRMAAPWRRPAADRRQVLLRVTARGQDLRVELTGPQGSGLLSSMMAANALALIAPDIQEIPAGGPVLLHLIDQPEDH